MSCAPPVFVGAWVDAAVGMGGAATACERFSRRLPTNSSPRTTTAATTICSRVNRRSRTTSSVACGHARLCDVSVSNSCRCALTHDEIHELPRNDDRLPDLAAVQMRLHLRGLFRARDQLLIRKRDRHLDPVADLPVHLDDELERICREQRWIRLRPRLLPQTLVPEPLPELFRNVRCVRLDQRNSRLGRETPRRIVRRTTDVVDELHDGGDRRVHREPPAYVVCDLCD